MDDWTCAFREIFCDLYYIQSKVSKKVTRQALKNTIYVFFIIICRWLDKDLMSWAGCQNNPIYLNFYLQKSLETFEKKSAEKIWSNKDLCFC